MHAQTVRGFYDELTKIAKKQQETPHDSDGKRVARGAAAGIGVLGANTAAGLAAAPFLLDGTKWEPGKAESMMKNMGMKAPIEARHQKVRNWKEMLSNPMSGPHFYHDQKTKKPYVNIPQGTGEAVAAHEVGHAVNHAKHGPRTLMASGMSGQLGIPTAIGSAIYSGAATNPSYMPALANAAVWAPRMLDETAASARAVKYMTKQHGLGQGLRKSLPLVPAWGSYAALAATPLAITAVRRHLYKKRLQAIQAGNS